MKWVPDVFLRVKAAGTWRWPPNSLTSSAVCVKRVVCNNGRLALSTELRGAFSLVIYNSAKRHVGVAISVTLATLLVCEESGSAL